MKTNYLKNSVLLVAALAITSAAGAQAPAKTANYDRDMNYDVINNKTPGKIKESIQTMKDGKSYHIELVNNKMTELYVDGGKIPVDKWGRYDEVLTEIRIQAKKDRIQAEKDQKQAIKDEIQAKRDQKQAMKDEEQAKTARVRAQTDQIQAQKNKAQAQKNQEEALKDQAQAKLDQQQAEKDQVLAQKDAAQAKIDQKQAEKDQIQAQRDAVQAKIDQKQAEEDNRLIKSMISDLVSDGIITDEKGTLSITLNSSEMVVNGKKQPDAVFARYKEKYKRFSSGNFTYENNSNGNRGIRMTRPNK